VLSLGYKPDDGRLRCPGRSPAWLPAYKRGAQYLLDTQFPDGSWYVRSRVVKLQPYFQSAFPFDHDQWISNSATAYAVMALAPVAAMESKSNGSKAAY
jgi:hypothetical protein